MGGSRMIPVSELTPSLFNAHAAHKISVGTRHIYCHHSNNHINMDDWSHGFEVSVTFCRLFILSLPCSTGCFTAGKFFLPVYLLHYPYLLTVGEYIQGYSLGQMLVADIFNDYVDLCFYPVFKLSAVTAHQIQYFEMHERAWTHVEVCKLWHMPTLSVVYVEGTSLVIKSWNQQITYLQQQFIGRINLTTNNT